MDLGLISVRYARALLKAGIEAKEAEKVYADMQTLAQNYSQMPALRITIDNPMLSKKQKESLLLTAAAGGSCDLTKRFVNSQGSPPVANNSKDSFCAFESMGLSIVILSAGI